jgi:succinate dehydrogenase / fumarate reductase, cytochrome b subunit
LVVFLVEHLIGNTLLLIGDGGQAFNQYTYDMTHNPLIKIVEFVLFGSIIGHIALTLYLNAKSRGARKSRYAVSRPAKSVPFASRFMVHTGLFFMVWLVVHLVAFFGSRITTDVEELFPGYPVTPFSEVVHKFSNPWFVAFYVVAMLVMATHLSHGLYSAIQTVGAVVNKKIDKSVRVIAWVVSILLSLGFAAIPIVVYFQNN